MFTPIVEDITRVEGIPDSEPHTIFLVDYHVFSNCDRQDVFTYNDEKDNGNGNVIITYLIGKATKRAGNLIVPFYLIHCQLRSKNPHITAIPYKSC